VSLQVTRAEAAEAVTNLLETAGVNYAVSGDLPTGRRVSARFKDVPLEEALQALADAAGVSYSLVGQIVVLRASPFGVRLLTDAPYPPILVAPQTRLLPPRPENPSAAPSRPSIGEAGRRKVTMDLTNVEVGRALQALSDSGASYVIEGDIPSDRRVTLHLKDVPLDDAVAAVADAAGLAYSVRGNVVVFRQDEFHRALDPLLRTLPAPPKPPIDKPNGEPSANPTAAPSQDGSTLTQFFALRYVRAQDLLRSLGVRAQPDQAVTGEELRHLPKGIQMATALGSSNQLLVVGTPESVRELGHLIQGIDVAPRSSSLQTRVFRLNYANAADVVSLIQQSDAAWGKSPGGLAGPRKQMSLAADLGTNSVVASGSDEELRELETLLSSLDVEPQKVVCNATLLAAPEVAIAAACKQAGIRPAVGEASGSAAQVVPISEEQASQFLKALKGAGATVVASPRILTIAGREAALSLSSDPSTWVQRLTVTPVVNPDGTVTVNLAYSQSALAPPAPDARSTTTAATVKQRPGDSFIITGLKTPKARDAKGEDQAVLLVSATVEKGNRR
jgi:type II secretory pathway component GspD/PulD (secretin)